MNEARRLDLRVVLAVVFLVAAIWAATSLARGPQQSSGDSAGSSPVAVFVQDEGDGGTQGNGTAPSGDDCPERGGGSGGPGDGSPDV